MATTQAPLEKTQEAELLRDALIEVERYREMDRLVPSMHNVVSIAALEVSCNIANPLKSRAELCSIVVSNAYDGQYDWQRRQHLFEVHQV